MDKSKKKVKCFFWVIVIFIFGFVLIETGNIKDYSIRMVAKIIPLEDRVHDHHLLKQYTNDKSLSNTIVLIGDSHLYYFRQCVSNNVNITNRAIPGETTKGIILRDTVDLRDINGSKIIIMAGYNDLKYRNVSQICRNLDILIHHYKSSCLIVLSLIPVDSKRTWINKQIRQINIHLCEQCRHENIPYINIYDKLLNNKGTGLNPNYSSDGVHLNMDGFYILKKYLQNAMDTCLDVPAI